MQILNEEGFKTSTGKQYTPKAQPKKEKRAARVLRETKEKVEARKAKATPKPKAKGGLFKRAADKLTASRTREQDKKQTGRSTATKPTPPANNTRRPAPPANNTRQAPASSGNKVGDYKNGKVWDGKKWVQFKSESQIARDKAKKNSSNSGTGVEGKPMPSNPPGQFKKRGLPPNQAYTKEGGVVQGNSGNRKPAMSNKEARVGDTYTNKQGVTFVKTNRGWKRLKGKAPKG